MELAPRYCRSCGSRILVKNVCHNCNNDPLKGDNYCYDCGALTPNAESCLQCGARYKTNFPVKPMLLIAGIFIAVVAITGFFLTRSGKTDPEPTQESRTPQTPPPVENRDNATSDTIVNKPDTAALINTVIPDTTIVKPAQDTSKPVSAGIFTPDELRVYKIRCSYFLKKQRGQVLFFIANGNGHLKINDRIYEMSRKRKGVDVAVFGSGEYEATIRIDGLSGSEKEWLASCTLIIKDIIKNNTSRHKVYSSCIEL